MKKKLTPILVPLGILAAVVFVVFAIMNPKNDSANNPDTTTKVAVSAAQKEQLKVGNSKGDSASKVVVTEFGDFQCPACGNIEKSLEATVLPQLGGKINFVFKHFPLTQVHKNALSSAYASESAAEQGKFWEMHDVLYAKQDEWSELADPQAKYEAYATQIGLDIAKFKSDMKASAVKARVERDKKLAEDLKLPGTPSFFVNGVYIELNTVEDLSNAIQKALAQ